MTQSLRTSLILWFTLALASVATAGPIISGDGESWSSLLDAVCIQSGSAGAPCAGTTVLIGEHPAWQDDALTTPLAYWVSYADTGDGGTVLAPQTGSAANPIGQTPIMQITETFTGKAGGALFVRFWADDTLKVIYNGVEVKSPIFTQGTCADMPIGCEPNEFWDLHAALTGGLDTIQMVAYQVGTGTTPNSNPFGVLYSGSFEEPDPVPEPASLLLLVTGLAGMGVGRLRKSPKGGARDLTSLQ